MKLLVLASKLPPDLDGIGDYSAVMARHWSREAAVVVFTETLSADPIPNVGVEHGFRFLEPRSILKVVEIARRESPDWVILQYNPFSWGRRGFNPWLIRCLSALRSLPGIRIALMVHERYVPLDTWAFRAMATWQRPQLNVLLRQSDRIFCSTESWVADLRLRSGGKEPVVSPVPSNIDAVGMQRTEARERLGIREDEVVLGFFGFAHVSKQLHFLRAAVDSVRGAGRVPRFLYIGKQVDAVRNVVGSEGLIADGALAADEVSRRFAAMDVHLCPFADGVSTRRGSMMTALQHGVATIGTTGESTSMLLRDASPDSLVLTAATDADAFAAAVARMVAEPRLRESVARNGRALYERHFEPQVVARAFLETLRKS